MKQQQITCSRCTFSRGLKRTEYRTRWPRGAGRLPKRGRGTGAV